MKKKRLLVLVLALVALIPAYAVLNEKDLAQTLSVLRYELRSAWLASTERAQRTMSRGARQRAQLVEMMQRSNELSLMLYSQKQDYTFDMTYALNEVSRQYDEFASQKLPFDDIITRLDIDAQAPAAGPADGLPRQHRPAGVHGPGCVAAPAGFAPPAARGKGRAAGHGHDRPDASLHAGFPGSD